MSPRFTVSRDQDAWLQLGPFGGWWWTPVEGPQTDMRQYVTKCRAARAARRALDAQKENA